MGILDFCFESITLPVICIHHKGEQIFMCLLAALLQWKNPIPPTIHFWHHFSPWTFEYQSLSNLDYKQGFFPSTLFPLRVGQDIEKLEHPQQKISKMKKVFLLTLYYLSWQSNFELENIKMMPKKQHFLSFSSIIHALMCHVFYRSGKVNSVWS